MPKHWTYESDLYAVFSCISEFTQSMNWALCVEIKHGFNLAFSTIIWYIKPSGDMSKKFVGTLYIYRLQGSNKMTLNFFCCQFITGLN